MTDTDMDQLANFLGHDIRIHREFYRLPEKTLQLAKVSKLLMALEQGRLAEFHGKNLDEIVIGPDEPAAEETLPPIVGNEIPPTRKRHKPPSAEDEVSSGVSAETFFQRFVLTSVPKPSAEDTLPPIEGNVIPPTRKRHKPPSAEDEVSSGVSAVRPSSKGKATQKRTPWQQTEVQAVERHMKRFITSCVVPAKND
ncbi:Hypothetical protein SMAX5B_021110, partial [Scophthalmus maximus]